MSSSAERKHLLTQTASPSHLRVPAEGSHRAAASRDSACVRAPSANSSTAFAAAAPMVHPGLQALQIQTSLDIR
jgi:hypothetical protein